MRLAASGAKGKLNYKPGAMDFLGPGVVDIDFWILSLQYNEEDWSLTAEFMNEPILWRDFGPIPSLSRQTTAEGWYIQGIYRLTPDLELLLRYDHSDLNSVDLSSGRDVGGYAKDWTLGLRWDVTQNFMLRAEYHRVDGGSWLSGLENDRTDLQRYWDMFALLASYRF